jgi:hypothetical protein
MELTHLERQRTELLRFVLLLMILVLGLIAYLSLQREENFLVVALTVVASAPACMSETRTSPQRLQGQLIRELIGKAGSGRRAAKTALKPPPGKSPTVSAISTVNAPRSERTFETALQGPFG